MTNRDAGLGILPNVISGYLDARQNGDIEAAVQGFTLDATVIDDGAVYAGTEEIRSWLCRSADEYTYTVEPIAVVAVDDDRYDVLQHLEGNFPGRQVDLHFRFTLRDGSMEELLIEP